MSRWIGLDYGTKRIGVAITDSLRIFVSPYTTIPNQSREFVLAEIKKIVAQQNVVKIIVGLPLGLNGEDTKKTKEVRIFYNFLRKEITIPLEWWDERYSTSEAHDLLKNKKLSWQESKKIVDQTAAAVILRSFLEHIRN